MRDLLRIAWIPLPAEVQRHSYGDSITPGELIGQNVFRSVRSSSQFLGYYLGTRTDSYLLVSLLALSIVGSGTLLSIPLVEAGEPAGDSASIMRCVGLLPSTPSCVSDILQPFETIVDDADNDRVYDAGEVVIVGPTPTVGSPLSNDGKILFRDTISGTISPPRWQTGEFLFYDSDGNNATTSDRIPLIGTPSTLTTSVKKDFRTRLVDLNADGVLTGIVRVTARLESLGGTQAEGTQEDVDGIQTVYTFDSTILKPMRASYPSGGVYPNPGL